MKPARVGPSGVRGQQAWLIGQIQFPVSAKLRYVQGIEGGVQPSCFGASVIQLIIVLSGNCSPFRLLLPQRFLQV